MSKYLLKVTEVYRVENEAEAKALIEEAKNDSTSVLVRYSTENKERKAKGEIVDEWKRVTLVRAFNDEKEPTCDITVSYDRE